VAEFVNEFMMQFGPDVSLQVSANLGLTPKAARQVIPAVIPMILGGLKRQMETRGGGGSEGRGVLLGSLLGRLFGKRR
jgi:hypothetical protein